eukprot:882180-Alexandrium_andersonii.AAC.1
MIDASSAADKCTGAWTCGGRRAMALDLLAFAVSWLLHRAVFTWGWGRSGYCLERTSARDRMGLLRRACV